MSEEKGPKWKREVVQDHKFDYIDLDNFHDGSCKTRMSYLLVYGAVLKSVLVYVADFWSALSLLVIGQANNSVDSAIPTEVSKWIFLAAILISFALLVWDVIKARRIVKSRDIAYAFTSVIANRYYSLKDYRYFCLFTRINRSRKKIDNFAFFVFFTLKGWKRLLLAEAPRQVINLVTLQALLREWIQIKSGTLSFHNSALGSSLVQQLMTGTMAFSTIVFAISFVLVCAAALMYFPLLCHIQGNLKEYCCHKVDKRIAELLRRQALRRQREALDPKLAGKKNKKKGAFGTDKLAQPTLPSFYVDDSDLSTPASPFLYSSHYRSSPDSASLDDRAGLTSHAQAMPSSSPAGSRPTSPPLSHPYHTWQGGRPEDGYTYARGYQLPSQQKYTTLPSRH